MSSNSFNGSIAYDPVTPQSPPRNRFIGVIQPVFAEYIGSRIARSAMAVWLALIGADPFRSGVVPIIATNGTIDHYNKTRDHGYYRALDAAQRKKVRF